MTRREFLRGLDGLSDEDARRRVEPMNSISWIVGHLAWHEHVLFVAWPRITEGEPPQYRAFCYGVPPSQPPLEQTMALWRASCDAADECLHAATEESLVEVVTPPDSEVEPENLGTRIVRNVFHYWMHIGEISAVHQALGHRPPDFVDLHDWSYGSAPQDRLPPES